MQTSPHKESQGVDIRLGEPQPRAADSPAAVPLRVVMLVANPCINDSRVIKEAETLAAAGHMVRVVCRETEDAPDREIINGVEYLRVKWPQNLSKLREVVANRRRYRSPLERAASVSLSVANLVITAHESVRRALRTMFRSVRRPVRRFLAQLLQFSFTRLAMPDAAAEWQPDVVHAHDLMTLPAAVKTARRLGAGVVYDAHELEQHRSNPGPLWARLWTRHHERKYAPLADRVVTVSDSIADHLEAELNVQRPLVVFNSPTVMSDKPRHRDVRGDLGLSDDVPLGVYVGGITFGRGLEELVEALAFAPEIHLATVGQRLPETENKMRELARRLSVEGRLHMLEPVRPHEVVPYISTADFGVYAMQNICLNHEYARPTKLFEMTMAGLPVAIASLTEMRRFIERTGTGIVMDETEPKDIARAMREVYARREELKPTPTRLAEIFAEFGWPSQARKLRDLYSSLARDETRRRCAAV